MNPKGDGAWRRSLLAKKIFTSLTLLQILSNVRGLLVAFVQKHPVFIQFSFCQAASLLVH